MGDQTQITSPEASRLRQRDHKRDKCEDMRCCGGHREDGRCPGWSQNEEPTGLKREWTWRGRKRAPCRSERELEPTSTADIRRLEGRVKVQTYDTRV